MMQSPVLWNNFHVSGFYLKKTLFELKSGTCTYLWQILIFCSRESQNSSNMTKLSGGILWGKCRSCLEKPRWVVTTPENWAKNWCIIIICQVTVLKIKINGTGFLKIRSKISRTTSRNTLSTIDAVYRVPHNHPAYPHNL